MIKDRIFLVVCGAVVFASPFVGWNYVSSKVFDAMSGNFLTAFSILAALLRSGHGFYRNSPKSYSHQRMQDRQS